MINAWQVYVSVLKCFNALQTPNGLLKKLAVSGAMVGWLRSGGV